MSERETLQKNLTQLQELGLNKIHSHSLTDCKTKVGFTSRNSGYPILADNEKIVFDIVVSNFGKGYDPKTGIFTAVKSGTYLLFADVRTNSHDNTCWIDLVRNGSPVTTVFLASGSRMSSDSTLAILHLDIGNKTICACKNETEDILLELQILKSITNTLQQNFSLLMLDKEILQKNLTQLQDDHDKILSQQVLGLNKIQSNKVTDYKTKIGFTAKNNDSIDPLADGEKIIIDTVVSNFGNGYDPSTGIFTAVKSGTYLLFVDVRSVWTTDDKTCWIDLMRNGSPITTVFLISSGTSMSSDSTLAIVHLDIGNKVWLRKRHHWHAGVCSLDNHLTFSGYLLNVM
ncbi:C1QL [Mytilus edulis]|uniref:C1QL n=1 Tax=Mytilus edulis TaxID=6550 RepID=A0A8S3TNT5_MYTED|nr:C1QL [Mytilus edulis]